MNLNRSTSMAFSLDAIVCAMVSTALATSSAVASRRCTLTSTLQQSSRNLVIHVGFFDGSAPDLLDDWMLMSLNEDIHQEVDKQEYGKAEDY